MSVYLARRKDGSLKSPYYQYDFTIKVDGDRRRFHGSTGESTKARAKDFEQAERRRLKAERPNDSMTLDAACYRYCAEVSKHQPSADDSAKALEHCARLIGGARRLVSVTADDIAMAVRKRLAETYGKNKPKLVTAATVNRQIVEPMRRVLRRAKKVWGMSCDPEGFDWGALRLREPKERVRELTPDEANALWAAIRPDYLPIIRFLDYRGIRVRAVIGMLKGHVDLAGNRVKVHMKGQGMAWQPLAPHLIAIIAGEMAKSPLPNVWTYEAQRGPKKGLRFAITYNGLRRVMRNAIKEAGIIDFRIHDLRHDFASKLLRATGNLALVQKALGHSDIASTARYAHVLDDDVSAGMEAAFGSAASIGNPIGEKSRKAK